MKYLNKLATVFCSAVVGLMAMTSCEGGDMYSVDSPSWLQEKIDSIKNAKGDSNEDIYQIGATDYSSGWWTDFSHYYIIPDGAKWTETFNLHINPAASNTYKNFALILTNDVDRGGEGYTEYGAIRFDNQPSGNSEWGSIDRSCIESNLTFETDTDPGVERLGGIVTLTVDRSAENAFYVEMNNGDVVKTYKLPKALDNLNADANNENIRCFLVVEGSYIDFLTCDIDQIRTTKTPDQQPVSMVLNRVPLKVKVGTTLKDAMANVTATVTYSDGGERVIPASALDFISIPDFESLGNKTLVAVYNKTYKEQNADKAVTATCVVNVVEKMSNSIGEINNTTGFLGVESEKVKINPNETYVVQFTNYSSCANNWNNFVVDFVNGADGRYGMARADLWCMDSNFGEWMGVNKSGFPANWDTWRADMDGAKVTLYITNVGDGTAELKADMVAANGNKYTFEYTNLNGLDPNDLYYRLTVDACHLEFDKTVGNESNTSGFLSEFTDLINVPSGKTVTTQFVNYCSCANNWNNFVVDFVDASLNRVGVARADLWCMDPNFAEWMGVNKSGFPANWDTWRADMDGAKVNISVTNVGDGTANLKIDMLAVNGNKYCFEYTNLNGINANDCNFRLSIDNSRIVQDTPFTLAPAASAKKYRVRRR